MAAVGGRVGPARTPGPRRWPATWRKSCPRSLGKTAVARLLQESPELAEARAGVQRARAAVAQQCAERVPNVDLHGAVQYNNASGNTIAGLEVGMALPVFNRNQGNIARAEAQLIAASKEVRRVELALQERLAGVFEQYANARQEVEKYGRDILPNAKTSLDLVHNGYRQGRSIISRC